MSETVKLRISDKLVEEINAEFETRRDTTVEAMEEHGWNRQAAELEQVEGETADQMLFILKQEVSDEWV
jgi:hypothetical protein